MRRAPRVRVRVSFAVWRRIQRLIGPVGCILFLAFALPAESAGDAALHADARPAMLALIVDDIGYNLERGRRAIALPGPIAVAVLPFAPHSTRLALAAYAASADVLLHEPMQATDAIAEPGMLTANMSDAALRDTFERALADVPNAVGVSNHTGSLLTSLRGPMRALMQALHEHGLFFVDSRTTPATVARDVAIESGVPAVPRDVFLDHSVTAQDIASEFERAVAVAKRHGHAVLIAHPYDESLAFLEAALPTLSRRGVEQVRLARLVVDVSPSAMPARTEAPASPRTTPAL